MTLKLTLENFIEKANSVHGEYDYSKSEYVNNNTKIIITCKEHGDFTQRPSKHLSGQGCPKCRYIKSSNSLKKTHSEFLEKAAEIHSDKYEYLQDINGTKNPIMIKCKICNFTFNQIPNVHLMNHGCPKCAFKNKGLQKRLDPNVFIERCKEIHGDLYDYSETVYITSNDKIKIFCKKCDKYFEQCAGLHLYSQSGCQECAKKTSKEEKQVLDFIKSFYDKDIIVNTRSIISPYELDIYIPEKKVAIEYNGLLWHSELNVHKKLHKIKTDKCKQLGIKLFHIFSDEWRDKQEIVKSMIRYRLGYCENKIYARNCKIIEISNKDGENFFNKSHISGNTQARIYFALLYNNEIVSCLSCRRPVQQKYGAALEIARFANKLNTNVIGGFQKLLKQMKEYCVKNNYQYILTYADLRFGDGNVYNISGFKHLGETPLDYWYTNGLNREFRFKYRADKENQISEKEIASRNNVYKIYGCGSNVYILKL